MGTSMLRPGKVGRVKPLSLAAASVTSRRRGHVVVRHLRSAFNVEYPRKLAVRE
jgi:hypothetical protein